MEEELLAPLVALQVLSLQHNSIHSLGAGLFSSNSGLRLLLLSDNMLTSLPGHLLAGLTRLQSLGMRQ